MKILVPGSFDILHHGHLWFLTKCRELGDVTIALGGDEYQESYKRRPIQAYNLRRETLILAGFPVIVERTEKDMRNMRPEPGKFDFIARGDDWQDNDSFIEACGLSWDYLHQTDTGLIVVPNQGITSTSKIIEACRVA